MLRPEILVSIIIPTRNRKEFLLDAVRSVLAQTHSNIQLVIHDNDSTDGTKEYLEQTIHDARLEYYKSSSYLSMTENWNAAFSKISGDFFVRLDDDNVFSNDFIETALEQLLLHEYDVVMYSPLIVNLHEKIYTLFAPEDTVFLLTRFQEAYFEYFNITDSNYALYKTDQIRNIFPDGNAYITTLPDRYMNYCLVSKVPTIRIGFSPAVKGITRFDYRAPYGLDYKLTYVDYDNLTSSEILQKKDCLTNFHMHRANTLALFLGNNPDSDIAHFFRKEVIAPELQRTLMKLGHIYMAHEAYSWEEFLIYNRYIFEILSALLIRPFARFEDRNVAINCIAVIRNSLLSNAQSLVNILSSKKRPVVVPDPTQGNKLVQQLIAGQSIVKYSQFSSKGSLESFLKKLV